MKMTMAKCLLKGFVILLSISLSQCHTSIKKRGIMGMASRILRSEVCYDGVGCFNTNGVFYDIMRRPFNPLPEDPNLMDIEFGLYTRSKEGKQRLFIDEHDRLADSSFNASNEVKFIVHGYMDNGLYKWVTAMTKELLIKGDYNIIVVDWSRGALPPYAQAVSNTRVVGAMMFNFIDYLTNTTGLQPENCHIIGHSLGAHVAGYCGQRIENLGRITGLDPSYPYFKNMSPKVTLDPSDANFVDVIHTDGQNIFFTGMGLNSQLGHMDFYPNGGRDQPGCTASKKVGSFFSGGMINGMRTFFACSHMRSTDYFIESINTICPFTSFECSSWHKFEEGQCIDCGQDGSNCAPMGFQAYQHKQKVSGANKKYFLRTNEESPFCYYNYWIKINLERKIFTTDVFGILYVTLHGSRGDLREHRLYEKDIKLEHSSLNNSYTLMLTSMVDLGKIKFGSMTWKKESFIPGISFFNIFMRRKTAKLYVDSIELYKLDDDNSSDASSYSKLCNRDDDPKEDSEKIILSEDMCDED